MNGPINMKVWWLINFKFPCNWILNWNILNLPCLRIIWVAPHLIFPTFFLSERIPDYKLLLIIFLCSIHKFLIAAVNLPVLIRTKIEKVIDFIVSTLVMVVVMIYLETPLRHRNFLSFVIEVWSEVNISYKFLEMYWTFLFLNHFAMKELVKFRNFWDFFKNYAFSLSVNFFRD